MSEITSLKFPFNLEKDQIEAVNSWLKNQNRGSIIYSTGTGKTEIAFECARRIAKTENSHGAFNILFVVPRIVLIAQNIRRLNQYGIKKECIGVFYGEKKDIKEITFSTYQSIIRNFDLIRNSKMVILDEVHLVSSTAKKLSNIFSILEEDSSKAILGLTATIDERDPKYSKIIALIPPVRKYMIKEAVDDGRLTEPEVIIRPVKLDFKERKEYEDMSKSIREISLKLKSSNPIEISRLLKYGGIKSRLAKQWFLYVQKRKKLLNETLSKLDETIKIVKNHPTEKIMIFSETIESINKIREMLSKSSIRAEVIHNKIKSRQRMTILDDWGKSFFVLLSVHTLEIGFDLPSVGIAIIVSNTQNMNQLIQRIGRVIRKSNNKNSALIYVIYVEETKDKKILKMLEKSLEYQKKIKDNNKQQTISAFL